MLGLKKIVLFAILLFLLMIVGTYSALNLVGPAPKQEEEELNLTELETADDYLEEHSGEDYLAESTDELLESSVNLDLMEEEDNIQELEDDLSALIKDKEKEFNLRLEDTNANDYTYNFDWELKTILVLETYYEECDSLIKEEKEVASDQVLSQISTHYQDWQLVERNADQVILRREIADSCPEHQIEFYLGLKDAYVAVFEGLPGEEGTTLKEKTEISIEYLPASEIISLEEGIKAESTEELFLLLEGLASIQDERIE